MKTVVDEYKLEIYAIYFNMVIEKNKLKEYCNSLIDGSGLSNISEISNKSRKIISNIYTYMGQLNMILGQLNYKVYEMKQDKSYIENINFISDLNNVLEDYLNDVTNFRKNLFQKFGFAII